MPVKIEFATTNEAFAEGGWSDVAVILRQIADSCERASEAIGGPVRDINGNTVGAWSASIDAEPESGE